MSKDKYFQWAPTRRDFLKAAGLTALQLELMWTSASAAAALAPTAKPKAKRGPNILLIVTDQERYLDKLPPKYSLPGSERLQELGTTFTNHQIASNVCTSSRSNIYTGQHIAQTRMFDNIAWPWVKSLSTDIPTLGHMMRELGYFSAYQGKFHMSRALEEHQPQPKDAPPKLIGRKTMESYGFSDYTGVGDIIGNTLGGYLNDPAIAAFTNRWLKERGQRFNADGTPWFFALNFINPHDVMYFNTDEPGKPVQEEPWLLTPIARAPDFGMYKQEWDQPGRDAPADRPHVALRRRDDRRLDVDELEDRAQVPKDQQHSERQQLRHPEHLVRAGPDLLCLAGAVEAGDGRLEDHESSHGEEADAGPSAGADCQCGQDLRVEPSRHHGVDEVHPHRGQLATHQRRRQKRRPPELLHEGELSGHVRGYTARVGAGPRGNAADSSGRQGGTPTRARRRSYP